MTFAGMMKAKTSPIKMGTSVLLLFTLSMGFFLALTIGVPQ